MHQRALSSRVLQMTQRSQSPLPAVPVLVSWCSAVRPHAAHLGIAILYRRAEWQWWISFWNLGIHAAEVALGA